MKCACLDCVIISQQKSSFKTDVKQHYRSKEHSCFEHSVLTKKKKKKKNWERKDFISIETCMCHIKPFRPFFVKVTMSNLTSSPKGSTSPVGARRVRTDLKTSENVYLTNSYGPTRSRASSPLTATRIRLPSSYPAHSYKRLHSNTTQGPTTSADEVRTTATTVATTRRFIRRSDFILTAAKHTVNDSRILSTSAPHEGSSYIRLFLFD